MNGGEPDVEAAIAEAAQREYQHQRECILQYVSDCTATSEDKKAGGKIIAEDRYGAEFDTFTIERASLAFLAVADVRMQVGSRDEQVAVAELLCQFRSLLPTAPLTTTLARVVRAAGSRNGQNGADTNKAAARAEAEKVSHISAAASRNPDGTLAKPGGVGLLMAKELGKKILSPKTVKKYDDINTGRVDDCPNEDRE